MATSEPYEGKDTTVAGIDGIRDCAGISAYHRLHLTGLKTLRMSGWDAMQHDPDPALLLLQYKPVIQR